MKGVLMNELSNRVVVGRAAIVVLNGDAVITNSGVGSKLDSKHSSSLSDEDVVTPRKIMSSVGVMSAVGTLVQSIKKLTRTR
jgi:hypothetical protein